MNDKKTWMMVVKWVGLNYYSTIKNNLIYFVRLKRLNDIMDVISSQINRHGFRSRHTYAICCLQHGQYVLAFQY